MPKYRILSLDGGGPWALIQVKALQKLYAPDAQGHDILKDFDLVAANSGGSLTLAGLIENRRLNDLLLNYFMNEENRKAVFREVDFWLRVRDAIFYWLGIGPKYSTHAKRVALTRILSSFGAQFLPTIQEKIEREKGKCPHFLICAFDYDRKRAMFFRSNRDSKAQSSAIAPDATLVDAVHASSNAPVTFFDEPAEVISRRFWDGAIAGHNNPVLVAVVEALAAGHSRDDIQALSIGTGSVRLPIAPQGAADPCGLVQQRQKPRIRNNIKELAGSILDDPPDVATFIAHVVLGQPLPSPGSGSPITSGSVVRMNPMIQPKLINGSWLPPSELGCDEFKAIAELPVDALEQPDVERISRLCDLWLDKNSNIPNQPIRSNSKDFTCEIGQPSFSEAYAAWIALKKMS
jgi:patatin-like phospholipase